MIRKFDEIKSEYINGSRKIIVKITKKKTKYTEYEGFADNVYINVLFNVELEKLIGDGGYFLCEGLWSNGGEYYCKPIELSNEEEWLKQKSIYKR